MRALLDTTAFLYWTAGGKKLSPRARKVIAQALERDLAVVTSDERFEEYGVTVEW